MTVSAGYSKTPLPAKLGLKDGQIAGFVDLPVEIAYLAEARAFAGVDNVNDWTRLSADRYDVIHMFTRSAKSVAVALPMLQDRLVANGMIWMSWPKKASKVVTDVTEDVIREIALTLRLVDVKVCAVTEIWSGLKLIIRKELRP